MTRICTPIDDTTLTQIDTEVKKNDISRAQWVKKAIDTYLTHDDTELTQLSTELEQTKHDLTQARSEREQSWREATQLRHEKTQLNTEQEQTRHKLVSLEASVADLARHKEELERLKVTHEKTLEAMTLKDDEIDFLRSHISQLTQSISQLALKPSEEEAQKKGWWQFWR
jgi:uncharacterized protein (DUF3084 family)